MNKTLINNVTICIDAVKAINIMTTKKAGYHSIYYDIVKAFNFCYDMTNCQLFDSICCVDMCDLKRAVDFNFKGVTSKELNKMSKRSISYLQYQLSELYNHYISLV